MSEPLQNIKVTQSTGLSLRSGETVDSRFLIETEIGKGGMGVVYRAQDLQLTKTIALKIMQMDDDVVIQRFIQEAKITTELSHPNVVSVRDFGIDSAGRPYLVMNYIDGLPLDKWIKETTASKEASSTYLSLACQIASGMEHAHSQRIIHRDLKASNIIITGSNAQEYQAKILDFGIAKLLNEEQGLTCTGQIVGTPSYMSPEQAMGQQADERSDIYSFGCLIYEMYAGYPPFRGENIMAVLTQHVHAEPQQAFIPANVWPLVQRCLAKDPKNRYESFSRICADLTALQEGKTLQRFGGQGRSRNEVRMREGTIVALIFVGLGVLLMIMVGYSAVRMRSASNNTVTAPASVDSANNTNTASATTSGRQYFGSATPADLEPGKIPPHQLNLNALGDAYSEADSFDEGSRRHFMKGEYDQAIMMLDFQTKTYKAGGTHYGNPDIETVYLAMAYMHLGECYVQKGQQDLAVSNYKKALSLYATVNTRQPKMYDQAVFGYVHLLNSMGKADEAARIQEEFQKTGKVQNI